MTGAEGRGWSETGIGRCDGRGKRERRQRRRESSCASRDNAEAARR